MHYNKQCNDLIKSEISDKNSENFIPTASDAKRNANCETTLSFEVNTRDRNTIKQHYGATDIDTYKETTTSCTSSTDSGVNISDNDEIPPSPTSSHLHSFPSSNSSSSETTTLNLLNKQFHNNYKNTNRDNNKNNNNSNNHIFNGDNDDDNVNVDDDSRNSSDFDNKLKIEQHRNQQQQTKHLSQQQFLNVENSSNGGNNTRYQPNQNIIESENVINISHQQNLTTATPTVTTLTTNSNDTTTPTTTLQHNEFINRPQRSASTSSSLSMSSSNANSSNHNPPSKMHHCSGSPVVSIRSINSSTIITSDSDSDSDLNSDTEGVHENYVIKKLGTQMTYPPNHPNIPKINSGHTVLNQKVTLNENQIPQSPLAALAAIGDSIGAAQALGPVPSLSAVAQRPQIGSIALSNSSDVTFGDKHFYEGPVTIQQFLIDSRDKWKDTNGKDNPTFVNENGETTNDAKDINSSPEQSGKRKKLIILSVLVILALLIVATVLGSKALNDSKSKLVLGNSEESRNNIPINSTIDTNGSDVNDDSECSGNGTLCLIDRDVWRAHPQKNPLDKQELPLHRVIISHTATDTCDSIKFCAERVRLIQEFHMDSTGWDDIGYNFLIGSDGRVYVGRGWDAVGAHTKGYNKGSVGITFIGTYIKMAPTEAQLNACQALLEEGVRLKKLTPNYHLYGARQFSATESPGNALYKIIKKWPHWSVDINLD